LALRDLHHFLDFCSPLLGEDRELGAFIDLVIGRGGARHKVGKALVELGRFLGLAEMIRGVRASSIRMLSTSSTIA
jgi:hypothetical protein